jgi:hypothetical protein
MCVCERVIHGFLQFTGDHTISNDISTPLTTYYPEQNEKSHNNSVRTGKVKRSKGELNVQSKCRENESSVGGIKCAAIT